MIGEQYYIEATLKVWTKPDHFDFDRALNTNAENTMNEEVFDFVTAITSMSTTTNHSKEPMDVVQEGCFCYFDPLACVRYVYMYNICDTI